MTMVRRGWVASSLLLGLSVSGTAWGQVPSGPAAAAPPASAPPPAAAPAPAATPAAAPVAAPAPVVAPSPQPQYVAVPDGYKLVRVDETTPPAQPAQPAPPPAPVASTAEQPYEEGDPIPAGYVVKNRPRRGLVIAGSIVTGIPWVFSVTGAVAADFENKSGFLVIPALGPWLMLASGGASDDDCPDSSTPSLCESSNAGLRAVIVLNALIQTAGAAMFVGGLAVPRKRLVRAPDVALSVVPMQLTRDAYGIGAVGTF